MIRFSKIKGYTLFTLVSLCYAALSVPASVVHAAPAIAANASLLKADTETLNRLDKMFDNLGGKEQWANAKSLYTVERVRHYKYGDGIVETVWRDLEHPAASIKLMHPKLNLIYAWNELGGWVSRSGKLRDLSKDEVQQKAIHWSRDLYTLLHQLASGQRKLSLKVLKPYGFKVYDESNSKIGEFLLTPKGALYQWQRFGGKESVTYIYGPHKSFGLVNFPDWSTTSDGEWGSYIVQIQPSNEPFDAHVSMEKPVSDCAEIPWQGGAVNTNCHEKNP